MIRIRIRLSALLGERRVKQSELARKTGISATTINRYFNEVIDKVSLHDVCVMCEALGCSLSDLLVEEDVGGDASHIADHRWEKH